jgi:hypothetical protein
MVKFLSILLGLLTTIFSPVYSQITSGTGKKSLNLRFDTTKTAILELKKSRAWLFDSTYKPANLTQNDLLIIDSFLIRSVNDFNSWQKKNNADHPWMIDLKSGYRKQLITVTNKKGEKEVWVNCFCDSFGTSWKSEILVVEDGATCYFNFKINLTTGTYYDFMVNSIA